MESYSVGNECEGECEVHPWDQALAGIWHPQPGDFGGVNAAVVTALSATELEHIIPPGKKQKRQKSNRCRGEADAESPPLPVDRQTGHASVPPSRPQKNHIATEASDQSSKTDPSWACQTPNLVRLEPFRAIQTAARASRVRALGSWTLIWLGGPISDPISSLLLTGLNALQRTATHRNAATPQPPCEWCCARPGFITMDAGPSSGPVACLAFLAFLACWAALRHASCWRPTRPKC